MLRRGSIGLSTWWSHSTVVRWFTSEWPTETVTIDPRDSVVFRSVVDLGGGFHERLRTASRRLGTTAGVEEVERMLTTDARRALSLVLAGVVVSNAAVLAVAGQLSTMGMLLRAILLVVAALGIAVRSRV